MTITSEQLQDYTRRIEQLAVRLGLDFYPVDFELVPDNFMTEIAVYGLPVRMPHWSFGIRYIHQLIQQGMGHSRIFEVMFPGDPCHAYLVDGNSLPENTLVVAHVLGHADFAKNNHLFRKFMDMAGGHILEQAAARAHAIEMALEQHGQERVEAVLDAALALEPHIDVHGELHRDLPVPATPHRSAPCSPDAAPASTAAPALGRMPAATTAGEDFLRRYHQLPGEAATLALTPKSPPDAARMEEYDLLWFIAHHAPDMAGWERDIFLAVREESFYFYPVYACQIMNEGWASYWHARLLREADFLPPDLYVSAVKAHSDVVRPYAAERQLALAINPYHLGFSMWENIIEKHGLAAARRICRDEDDFGFVRNYLDEDLAQKLDLFVYASHAEGDIRVASRDIHAIRESILAPKFNYGAPRIAATRIGQDGSLELTHDWRSDGRGLDMARADHVLNYIARVWRRPVSLHTVDERGHARDITTTKIHRQEPQFPGM